jgi:hypothetical protein
MSSIHIKRRCAIVLALGDRVPFDLLRGMCLPHRGFRVLAIQDALARVTINGHAPNRSQKAIHAELLQLGAYLFFAGQPPMEVELFTASTGISPRQTTTMIAAKCTGISTAIAMFIAAMFNSVPGVTVAYGTASRRGAGAMLEGTGMLLDISKVSSVSFDLIRGQGSLTHRTVHGVSTLVCMHDDQPEKNEQGLIFDLAIFDFAGSLNAIAHVQTA